MSRHGGGGTDQEATALDTADGRGATGTGDRTADDPDGRDGHPSDSAGPDPVSGGSAAAAHARSVHTLADAMLRWGLRLSVPVALIALGVATLTAGGPGLVGAGFGVVLGFGSALVTIAMMRTAATRRPSALLNFALGGYALKMSALLLVMLLLRDATGFSRAGLAFGMLVVVVAWAVAEVAAFRTTKIPTIIVAESTQQPRPGTIENPTA